MSICREFCEMVEELIEDLDGVFEGTCLAKRDDNDRGRPIAAPEPGDIIGVDRGIYQHYGIYAGDNSVIPRDNSSASQTLTTYFGLVDLPKSNGVLWKHQDGKWKVLYGKRWWPNL